MKLEKIDNATAENGSPDYAFNCPGCGCSHGIWLTGPHKWGWNGSMTEPTITPSILVRWSDADYDENKNPIPGTVKEKICHSFITLGRIKFLNDCTHKLAGRTVDLPEIE